MGFVELTVVIIILALVFGAGQVGPAGDALGRAVKSLRKKPIVTAKLAKPEP